MKRVLIVWKAGNKLSYPFAAGSQREIIAFWFDSGQRGKTKKNMEEKIKKINEFVSAEMLTPAEIEIIYRIITNKLGVFEAEKIAQKLPKLK